MTLSEALARMRATMEFQIVMKAADEKRPLIFPLDPKQPVEQQTALAMYRSGEQNGFDLLYQFLRGKHG